MKLKIILLLLSLGCATAWLLLRTHSSASPRSETFYYGYSMKGKLVGYMRVSITSEAASRARTIESTLTAKVRLLGFDYDIHKTETYRVDSATHRIIDYDSLTTAGSVVSGASVTVRDGAARYVSKSDHRNHNVKLPPDALFHDPFYRPFFARDLPLDGQAKTYRYLDVQDGVLHTLRVVRMRTQQIETAGRIPARLVSGCMYLPRNDRGVLGGHVWTEIHIGGAGWIPVDANHAEIDRLDSGHIRLGHTVVAAPEEAEILEYRLRATR